MDKEKQVVIKKGERRLMYAFAGIVDLIQIILDAFIVSEIANHFIDIVVGAIILIYAAKRKLLNTNKSLTLAAVFIGEQIPFVNALPFWVYDIYNIYKGVPTEKQEISKTPGITTPRIQREPPVNAIKGTRPPRITAGV